jgi:hypothetical protein
MINATNAIDHQPSTIDYYPMEELAELLQGAEPYTSYRYILGLVLTGLTVYYLYTSIASIRNLQGLMRDLNRQVNEDRLFDDVRKMLDPEYDVSVERPLKAKPGRIIKLSILSASLKLISWSNLRYVLPELIGVIVLLAGSCVAYWYVFTLQL